MQGSRTSSRNDIFLNPEKHVNFRKWQMGGPVMKGQSDIRSLLCKSLKVTHSKGQQNEFAEDGGVVNGTPRLYGIPYLQRQR